MYNEVEVKAILIAVHNIENVGLNSKKVLLNSIEWLRCQYEITQDESFLIKAVWHPFIRMIKKKCKAVDAEKLNLMLWKIYMVSSRKEEFVTAAKKELQPYLTKKDEKQIDTTYDTTYTIDRRH